ncbi:MAG: DUF2157 domain-containing protein [Alphaproteobacteria bacterium PRO2]|nr:DUF2157 domain-containing protein [Alphaproteobacteria bacterium PRO2]
MTVFSAAQKDGLEQILRLMDAHNLSGADVKKAAAEHKKAQKSEGKESSKGEMILRLFLYMGGALIFAGLSVFIETIWEDIGSLSRVIITLGTGFTAYICGVVFALDKRFEKAATPAFILAFIMQPTGLFVLLDEYFPGDNAALGGMVVFAPLALQQFLTFIKFRYSSLLLYSLLYLLGFAFSFVEYFDLNRGAASLVLGTFLLLTTINMQIKEKFKDLTPLFFVIATVLFFSGVYYFVGRTVFDSIALSLILSLLGFAAIKESKTLYVLSMLYMTAYFCGGPGGGWGGFDWHFYNQVAAVFTGTSLVLAGQWLRRSNYISLHPLWMFLGTGFALGGLYSLFPAALQPVAIAFAGVAIYGALLLKSRAVLAAAVLSMIGFIIAYSAEHFANTIAWPVLLIFFGILVLASGFAFARLAGRIKASA